MPLVDNAWYVDYGDGSTTGYYAVTAWTSATSQVTGDLIRQNTAPAVNSERVFVCVASTGGTGQTGAVEPTWTVTRGALNTDNTVTWQEATGIAALNSDASTDTPTWTTIKNTAIVLGQVIESDDRNFTLICTTAGTAGSGAEPSWSAYTAAGATTADNTVTWTTLKDSGNRFGSWAAPHARLANAEAANWGADGDSFYVASEHAETQGAAMVITPRGSATAPCRVLCVNKSNVPPTSANLTTGASITTTGSNGISFASGNCYFFGITINSSTGAASTGININPTSSSNFKFDTCALAALGTTGAGTKIIIGTTTAAVINKIEFYNTTVQFSAVGDSFSIRSSLFLWTKTPNALQGATFPTTLFGTNNAMGGDIILRGVDLSALNVGKTIVGALNANKSVYLIDCEIGSSVTVATAPSAVGAADTYLIRTDSSGTNYRSEKYSTTAVQTVNTSIVRSGGASDGTTAISWRIVTTANSGWSYPFESIPIQINNTVTASDVTVTLYGTWNSGSVPNNDDIWIGVEYMGSSATPVASFATTTKADILATGTALTADGSSWGGGGSGAGWSPFSISVTLSAPQPAMTGYFFITVYAAKVSSTFYIDPKVVLS